MYQNVCTKICKLSAYNNIGGCNIDAMKINEQMNTTGD